MFSYFSSVHCTTIEVFAHVILFQLYSSIVFGCQIEGIGLQQLYLSIICKFGKTSLFKETIPRVLNRYKTN